MITRFSFRIPDPDFFPHPGSDPWAKKAPDEVTSNYYDADIRKFSFMSYIFVCSGLSRRYSTHSVGQACERVEDAGQEGHCSLRREPAPGEH
jgi:hypothetical protein